MVPPSPLPSTTKLVSPSTQPAASLEDIQSRHSDLEEEYGFTEESQDVHEIDPWMELNENLIELNHNLHHLSHQVEQIKPKKPSKKTLRKHQQKKKRQQQINQAPAIKYTVMYSEKRDEADPKIIRFIDFCIKRQLFNDQTMDLSNRFAIFETQLPDTFDSISVKGKIKKRQFFDYFLGELQYPGGIDELRFIYQKIDRKKKGVISWTDFSSFFIPFIRRVIQQQ